MCGYLCFHCFSFIVFLTVYPCDLNPPVTCPHLLKPLLTSHSLTSRCTSHPALNGRVQRTNLEFSLIPGFICSQQGISLLISFKGRVQGCMCSTFMNTQKHIPSQHMFIYIHIYMFYDKMDSPQLEGTVTRFNFLHTTLQLYI